MKQVFIILHPIQLMALMMDTVTQLTIIYMNLLMVILGLMFILLPRKMLPLTFNVSKVHSSTVVVAAVNKRLIYLPLQISVAPVMAIKGKTLITIKQNEQLLKLNCRVYGSPLPSINWQKDGMSLPAVAGDSVDTRGESDEDENEDDLRAGIADGEDEGEGRLDSVQVNATTSPSKANDLPVQVYNSSLSYSISNEVMSKCSLRSTLTLTIMNVVDLGLYHCIASNVHGKSVSFYRINGKWCKVT